MNRRSFLLKAVAGLAGAAQMQSCLAAAQGAGVSARTCYGLSFDGLDGGQIEDMKYLLSHRTSYTYASSVDSAHHIAHLRAREFPGQKVSAISIATSPEPALAVKHVDHFGNLIDIYARLVPGADLELRGATNSPSILIDALAVAGL
jgi:hypothetical protein